MFVSVYVSGNSLTFDLMGWAAFVEFGLSVQHLLDNCVCASVHVCLCVAWAYTVWVSCGIPLVVHCMCVYIRMCSYTCVFVCGNVSVLTCMQ